MSPVREKIERIAVFIIGFDPGIGKQQHRRVAENILVRNFLRRVERHVLHLRSLGLASVGYFAEILFDQFFGLSLVEIARYDERRVAGRVIFVVKLLDVIDRRAAQIGNLSDHGPAVRMSLRKQVLERQVPCQTVRHVLALTFFVRHDVDLAFEPALGHRVDEIAHTVGLHPQHLLQRIARHGLEIDGTVVARAAVERAAERVYFLEKGVARQVLGTLEEHVLEKVRETRFARFLAVTAHMVLDSHGNDRIGGILVQYDFETVGQPVLLVLERSAVVCSARTTTHAENG